MCLPTKFHVKHVSLTYTIICKCATDRVRQRQGLGPTSRRVVGGQHEGNGHGAPMASLQLLQYGLQQH